MNPTRLQFIQLISHPSCVSSGVIITGSEIQHGIFGGQVLVQDFFWGEGGFVGIPRDFFMGGG